MSKTITVRFTRPTYWAGALQSVGATLELPNAIARELFAMGKAEVAGELPAPEGPLSSASAPELTEKKSKRA